MKGSLEVCYRGYFGLYSIDSEQYKPNVANYVLKQ